jgi:hypothetical protein
MGDNLAPNGLSRGSRVFCSRSKYPKSSCRKLTNAVVDFLDADDGPRPRNSARYGHPDLFIFAIPHSTARPKPRACRHAQRYPAPDPGAGNGLSGAPPTETGPTGLGSAEGPTGLDRADVFLRDVPVNRAPGFGFGMEEVVSGGRSFCRDSTRAASEES